MAHPTKEEEIPCALSHHISMTQKKVDELSLVERQLAFQHWVAYVRTRTPGMSSKQRFICPLSSCTTSHADFESLLNHVAVCPRLGAAHYWCSECSQEEHFPTGIDSPFASRQSALRRMGSRVKGAVLFFKHLGFRGHGSRRSYGLKQGHGIFELDSESQCRAEFTKAELPTRQTSQIQRLRHPVRTLPELAARRTCVRSLHELPTTFIGAELMDTKCNDTSDGLDHINNHDPGRISPVELVSPGISPATYQRSPMSFTSHVFSPLLSLAETTDGYQAECEGPVKDVSDIPACCCEISERMAGQGFLEPTVSGSVRATHPWTGPHASCAAVETLTLRDRIEELHHVLQTLWSECLRRLSFNADLLPEMAGLSPDGLLEQGLQVLQDVIVGKLPRSFQRILTLVLLALACAYVLHEDCNVNYWSGLLQGMMRWRYMIQDLDDRKTFVRVVARLASQPQEFRKLRHTKNILSTMNQSSCAPNRATPGHQQSNDAVAPGQAQVTGRLVGAPRSLDDILEALKKEMLFTTCLEFLDDVAYAEVLERSVMYRMTASWYIQQHAPNIEDMSSSIIWNLRQRPEMEIITNEINDAHKGIVTGLLRNPREVEVTLLSHCMKACRDMPMHKHYRQIISSVCDQPMLSMGPNWRAHHHAIASDKIMAISISSFSLPTYEEAAACTFKPKRTRYEPYSTPSTSSDASTHTLANSLSSSATPASPSALTEDTDYAIFPEGYKVDNLTEDTFSASPRSQSPPSSKDGKGQCAQCNGVFLKSNLNRHVNTVHQPRPENILCRNSSCASTFTRQDNLEKHMRKKHGEVTPNKQGVSKRQKFS